jgi:fumarylacetoacetase
MTDATHDPGRRSWVQSANAAGCDFPIQNLPFGVFQTSRPRVGVAIGDQILDVAVALEAGLLRVSTAATSAVRASSLNALMALEPRERIELRERLSDLLDARSPHAGAAVLVPMRDVRLLLPSEIGDYTDFYASIHHATRVGMLFRPDRPLMPNYKFIPIGYHGRASSIVVSGTPVVRPHGQMRQDGQERPEFGPTGRLDYEAELGIFVGPGNRSGERVLIDDADRHLFGACLLNDWSARDIQSWESQPLGPFLAKNFASSISPWVVTAEALAPFRCSPSPRPPGDPEPLSYLRSSSESAIDIIVEVFLRSERMRRAEQPPFRLSRASFRDMYWTPAQLVAHHTAGGCNLRAGDLIGSGTISGPERGSEGCLLEATRNGSEPVALPTGELRAFLADGDEVTIRAFCERDGYVRIGFGECVGVIAPARSAATC